MKNLYQYLVPSLFVLAFLVIWQGSNSRHCSKYEEITGRTTFYERGNCYVEYKGEIYTRDEIKEVLGSQGAAK